MNRTAPVPRTVMKSYRGLIAMDKGVGYPPPRYQNPFKYGMYILLTKKNKQIID